MFNGFPSNGPGNDPSYLTDEMRAKLLESHPIREKSYVIPTKMLDRTYEVIRERVWMRRTGVFFYASPRMGKTTCVGETKERLEEEFSTLYVTRLDARDSQRPSHAHMYKLLLEAQEHVLSRRSDVNLLFNNAVTDIQVQVGARHGSQYVLLIDEAHLLNQTDLQQLLLVHNALERIKIKMTTVSFAQPEIMHRRTALIASKQRQIIARFLSEPITFEGCRHEADLEAILNVCDQESDYPADSGWSYTRFFVPRAYASGFRLRHYTKKMWAVLTEAAQQLDGESVPMEHICLTIEYCLLAGWDEDAPNFLLDDGDIKAAVGASNLATFNGLMGPQVC